MTDDTRKHIASGRISPTPHPKALPTQRNFAQGAAGLLTPKQLALDLTIAKEVEVDGVGMGVLSNGVPYLTGRGLARMCDIDQKSVVQMAQGWAESPLRPREAKIRDILRQQGHEPNWPYMLLMIDGVPHHAYPDNVCMAVLEYYAFEAGPNVREHALRNYRLLARSSFRDFIYKQVGFNQAPVVEGNWKPFHDRLDLNWGAVPDGYFSVFKEINELIATFITRGVTVDAKFIPDISVGLAWSKYWGDKDLASSCGTRTKYMHNYPGSFPQAKANPHASYCYPDAALPEFRQWFRQTYTKKELPHYLSRKERAGELPRAFTQAALAALEPPAPKHFRSGR